MKTWREIAALLAFPKEALEELEIAANPNSEDLEALLNGDFQKQVTKLVNPHCWEAARESLKEVLQPDKSGLKMLLVMLTACGYTYEAYREKGIEDSIFVETMNCFPRFVNEHKVSYGNYGFDRDFWTERQLSMQLFRLGELEYEMCRQGEEKTISVHIPSDADISRDKVEVSFKLAQEFFETYYPEYAQAEYTCYSWLLSPALTELLPAHSRILEFQSFFEIEREDTNSNAVLEWVFKRKGNTLQELPEDTSLQKKMKAYLLSGEKVGEAFGRLHK